MPNPAVQTDQIVALARRLVQTPSVNPMGDPGELAVNNEDAVADLLIKEFEKLGVPVRRVMVAKGRPIVLAEWGRGEGPTLMLNSHLDTVGVKGMAEPFSGRVESGRLYGRGSADAKGGLAAMVGALASIVESPAEADLPGRVILALVPDEEHEGLGSQFLRDHGPYADAAVVVEPTDLRIGVGQAGGVKFRVTTRGRATHACVHRQGVSAILHMARVIPRLVAAATRPTHPLVGHAPFSIGTIHGGEDVSIVPDLCQIEADRRILPGESWDGIRAELEVELAGLRTADPTLDVTLEEPFLGPVYGFVLPDDHPLVVATVRAFRQSLGRDAIRYVTPFAADGMYLTQAGIPTVTFGPGTITSAHSDDESVDLDQVFQAAQVLAALIVGYCGRGTP